MSVIRALGAVQSQPLCVCFFNVGHEMMLTWRCWSFCSLLLLLIVGSGTFSVGPWRRQGFV